MQERRAIPGSAPIHATQGSWSPAATDQTLSLTVVIRRPARAGEASEALLSGSFYKLSKEQAETLLRADDSDLAAVKHFVESYGLKVVGENAAARTLKVEGTIKAIGQAFGVQIECREEPSGKRFLSYRGELTAPSGLAGIIEAVLGLDQRPIARQRSQSQ